MDLLYFLPPNTPCPHEAPPGSDLRIVCCTGFDQIFPTLSVETVFILAQEEPHEALRMLYQLRRHPATSLQPIFCVHPLTEESGPLYDGIFTSLTETVRHAQDIITRLKQLDHDVTSQDPSDFMRILCLLHSRPGLVVQPVQRWSHEFFYVYPLVDALVGDSQIAIARLENLEKRKLVQHRELIDRIRHCPNCHGAHLNFIDICPNCGHLDILQKAFLHCFTCGHVAPEDRFLAQGTLTCPHCQTRLRHIGSDYDRPLENFECQNCRHVFIEPQVQARCMHCGTLSAPDKLTVQLVHSYEITSQGIQAAKSGNLEDVFALLDTVNSVSPTYFLNLVNWLLSLSRRHKDERFTIIGMRIINIEELSVRFGKQVVMELMDTLAARLQELIRTTDLTTRTGQQIIWILLPKTGKPNHQVVLDRLIALNNLIYHVEDARISFETVVFNAPEDTNEGETGKLLLARLEGEFD